MYFLLIYLFFEQKETTMPDYLEINKFFQEAAASSIVAANGSYPDVFNEIERKALSNLSIEELKGLAELYKKLSGFLDDEGNQLAAAWTCNAC